MYLLKWLLSKLLFWCGVPSVNVIHPLTGELIDANAMWVLLLAVVFG